MGQRLILVGMALLGCAHLLFSDHYPIINYDSFYFHWTAERINAGEPVALIGQGLSYPIAYLSRVVGLETASLMVSPILAIITGLVLFWGVSKLYSRRIALLSVVCFAVAQVPRFMFMSGNLDRDGLNLLIMTVGIFGLLLSRQNGRYLVLTFLSIPLLYLSWNWFALVQYIPVLISISLLTTWSRGRVILLAGLWGAIYVVGRLVLRYSMFGGTDISELEPFNLESAIQYATITIPFVIGLKHVKSTDSGILAWAAGFFLLGAFASRLSVHMVIPVCIIGGIGLSHISQEAREWKYIFVVGCLIFVSLSWMVPQNVKMPNDWEDALGWVKENTAEDADVAVWWSYGYWVLDIAERDTPATQATEDVADIAALYCAETPQEVWHIMVDNGWEYAIISARECNFIGSIEKAAQDSEYDVSGRATDSFWDLRVYTNDTVAVIQA